MKIQNIFKKKIKVNFKFFKLLEYKLNMQITKNYDNQMFVFI